MNDPYLELSTQQTHDFLAHFDDDDSFPKLDSELEQILSQLDPSSNTTTATAKASHTTTASISTANASHTTTASVSTAKASRTYSSPKEEKAARANSIAKKTKEQTDWAVHVWTAGLQQEASIR